ncbi:hypothetical protein RE6C_02355 [Rhodopirellula europaea 6C]|uniref:Uncharacterized protein n=1 Tax=Rhodopirellula europaea 6C TaxID=1263867 RepID=M2AW84_9BACT|nr:hypothetical protein RE6C_02355 [Rhodopirellula europaea 6C]
MNSATDRDDARFVAQNRSIFFRFVCGTGDATHRPRETEPT